MGRLFTNIIRILGNLFNGAVPSGGRNYQSINQSPWTPWGWVGKNESFNYVKGLVTSHKIVFKKSGNNIPLYLRGIIYLGGYHFTARFIDSDGNIWFHDGQRGHLAEKDGTLETTSDKELRTCRGRKLVLAIYAQE